MLSLLTSCESQAQIPAQASGDATFVNAKVAPASGKNLRTSQSTANIPDDPNYIFPKDAGIVDVSKAPYHITPKLSPDETTKRLNQAILDHCSTKGIRGRTIYLPNGIYRVNDTVVFERWGKSNPDYRFPFLTLLGQSRDKTIIQLVDNAPGYNDKAKPKAVVSTLEAGEGAPADLFTFIHFGVFIHNLTVDTGKNNPGATGVHFLANNMGAMRDVTIRGESLCGLEMNRIGVPGPAIVRNVRIEGFDYGVQLSRLMYPMTFEHIELKGQRRAGMQNHDNGLWVRNLKSSNSVPAFENIGANGLILIDDATLQGGAASSTAIENRAGHVVARDIRVLGYGTTIRDGKTLLRGNIKDFVSGGNAFNVKGKTRLRRLGLPVKETPQPPAEPLSNWVNVRSFGATAGDQTDDTNAIQKAIDSLSDKSSPNYGKTTIYFPNIADGWHKQNYFISRPLRLHGNVRRVIGFMSALGVTGDLKKKRAAMFVVEKTKSPTLWIEKFVTDADANWNQNWTHFAEQKSKTTLVLRDFFGYHGYLYRAQPGAGNAFFENVHTLHYDGMPQEPAAIFVKGQNIWARQFDPEKYEVQTLVEGAKVWILGYKTEYGNRQIVNRGGQVEILGAWFWAADHFKAGRDSLLLNESGKIWISFLQSHAKGDSQFPHVLREGDFKDGLPLSAVPQRDGWADGIAVPVLQSGF